MEGSWITRILKGLGSMEDRNEGRMKVRDVWCYCDAPGTALGNTSVTGKPVYG